MSIAPRPDTQTVSVVQRVLRSLAVLICTAVLCLAPNAARAQGIESVLSPGKVIQGHAKAEADCANCHVKFDREAQDRLCADCHKDVRADLKERRGFHGRQKPQACRSCHTEHKGRDASIARFDSKQFDHNQTDYRLAGKHSSVECKSCHLLGRKWRDAATDCLACHRKDDVHKAALGAKCADCHDEVDWKKTSFDHSKTRFPLNFKHLEAKCNECHKDQRYLDAPATCIGCHRKDDEQWVRGRRGHQGQFGEKCADCHTERAWKPSSFNHDKDTDYALKGKHRPLECKTCHTGPVYKQKLGSDCLSCHKKDDKHEGSLGRDCASCHNERGWKEQGAFDHGKTEFPLLGKHADADCKSCHKSAMFKDAPTDCLSCHQKEDKHEGTLGKACGDCHSEKDWKNTKGRFDHDRTQFALRNAHRSPPVECKACHASLKQYRRTPLDCLSCHKKDDKHQGQQGTRCEDCHTDRDWKTTVNFDHSKSRFPLTGRHVITSCKDCHNTARFKDAARECYACHKKEDTHQLTQGRACETCHNARAWGLWSFNHDKSTDYPLEASHRKVRCQACHTQQAPSGKPIAAVDRACWTCHRKDDTHDGGFGTRCEQCHSLDNWRHVTNRSLRGQNASELPAQAWDQRLGFSSHARRRTAIRTDRNPT